MKPTPGAVVVLAASCVVVLGARDRAQHRTFRGGIDLVTLGVTVADRKGHHLTDLSEADFEVYEDGRRQALRLFVPCDAAGPSAGRPDLHLGALLDVSGSMEEDLRFARGAAIRFLGSRPEASDLTLVQVESRVRVSRFEPSEFSRLVELVRGLGSEGQTALWDGIGVYLDAAAREEGRKVLVLYTDGGDNASSLSFGELVDLLKASDVTVHAIGLTQHQRADAVMDLRWRLQRLAEATGGQAFFPVSVQDLDRAYAEVAAEIDAQYTLGYVSSDARADGRWRKVEIRVTRPGLQGARVRARQGYFAPRRPAAGGQGA